MLEGYDCSFILTHRLESAAANYMWVTPSFLCKELTAPQNTLSAGQLGQKREKQCLCQKCLRLSFYHLDLMFNFRLPETSMATIPTTDC